MKIKFPLYAKILFWFFLNVVFLCVVFYVIARVQFRFGLNSLIAGPAGERIQAVAKIITAELKDRPSGEWDDVLKEFSEAYKVQFYLFRNDGEQLAGEPVELPLEVHKRVAEPTRNAVTRLGTRDNRPPMDNRPPPFVEPLDRPVLPRPNEVPMPNQLPKFMLHTSNPGAYWVVVRTLGIGPDRPRPIMMTLVVMSPTLTAGGLFVDLAPWIIGGIGIVLISALFWFPLLQGITRSISQITQATGRIAEGQFDVRVPVKRQDELGLLGDAINQMAGRLSGLVTGQKRFLGDIAHELCSPVARIQMALGILEERADEKQKTYLKDLREEVEQMSNLVNELLSFSKASFGKAKISLKPVSVKSIVEKAVARECAGETTEIKIDVSENFQVLTEPEMFLRAVCNVLRNAIRYSGDAGPITISATREGEKTILTIEDCGAGIPEDAIAQVFDPFYRVDTSRARETGGVGLGLSIVKTCIESCGGKVSCENRQPAGLRVKIEFPAAD